MRTSILTAAMLALLFADSAFAQPAKPETPAKPDAKAEESNQKASQLEADLSKLRDTTPEAAPLMLELVDLYHANARVFGLIRVAERFVATQPQHPRHKDVMLKLLDGLLATSRNKEVTSNCRQFLTRYATDPECARVEVTLARVLEQLNEMPPAADAHAAVWLRQGDTPQGRASAARAVALYSSFNNKDALNKCADLAGLVVEKLPVGGFSSQLGMEGVYALRRTNEYAKSNLLGNKLIAKGLPIDKPAQKTLHYYMGENYSSLGQRVNAVESFRKARAQEDGPDLHARLILEMHYALATVAEMEPLVNEFMQKYPERPDRFTLRGYLAHACFRAMDKARGLQILAEILPFDAANASVYVQQAGTEPADLAAAEQVLNAAIAKNQPQAAFLRYVLGLELIRDRVKDIPKARQIVREMVTQTPSNDGYTQQAISWLLYTAPNDAEFQSDIQALLKARTDRIYWTGHRSYLPGWIKEASRNKDHKDHAAWAQARLEEADAQPFFKDWLATEVANVGAAQAARAKLIAPESLKNLNDLQAHTLLWAQAMSYYNSGSPEQRAKASGAFAEMGVRFPTDPQVVYYYLFSAYNYGPPEAAKPAVEFLLKQEPISSSGSLWYYLMLVADRAADPALVTRSYQWIQKAQEKFGPEYGYAYHTADVLEKYGATAEALDLWQRTYVLNRDSNDSRNCVDRLLAKLMGPERTAFLQQLVQHPCYYSGTYAAWMADDYLKAGNLAAFEKTLKDAVAVRNERPITGVVFEETIPQQWVDQSRANKELAAETKVKVYSVLRDLNIGRPSATAELALLELDPPAASIVRLLAYQDATMLVGNDTTDWDRLMPYAQASLTEKDFMAAASLLGGMLANIPQIDPGRKQHARELITQSYSRIGGVGLAIDETSPIAPLMQAALYLRLGDERLAFDSYIANQKLFDEHKTEVPIDLLLFVCESHIAAGGDENFNRVEDILTAWLVKFSEAKELDDSTKASVQLMLAKNFFKSQRYDVSRSEFTTVLNRYPNTKEALEAEFGIGESYMAQKVYDQAESVFDKLSNNRDRDIVIRAEFLRGVLASRRGDRDEARIIFKGVLERVPNIELANQALFNLSEVYGAEQRYLDQLELLRTIGRLGSRSKRWHAPGEPLSIVVQDSDLGISRGHAKIPVKVTTIPGGDEETIFLYSGGAGKGLFRADLETSLGKVTQGDKVLQLSGHDTIKCDYPDEFKAEFKNAPLSDAEIRVAANGKLEAASGKIIDKDKETFSERLEREEREKDAADKRLSQGRPVNQIKPGNPIYMRVRDADRDLSDTADTITVKLVAASGDQVQVALKETGPHTGQFEGTAKTSDLPAGALASDTSIDHSPLMAIDQDVESAWISEPDGATPKWLSTDMKDLRTVSRVSISTPNPTRRAPVRGELLGSNDGRFWFQLASNPVPPPDTAIAGEFGVMTKRVYSGNYTNFTTWDQVANLSKNGAPVETGAVEQLLWSRPAEAEDAKNAYAVLWHGKLVQPRAGAARFSVRGVRTAIMVDGRVELPVGVGNRTADVWLEAGTHELTIFAAMQTAFPGVDATWATANKNSRDVVLVPFRASDFDLEQPAAKPARLRTPPVVVVADGVWNFQFQPIDLRHVKFVIHEYVGEAVAINHVEIGGLDSDETYIPTKADVLSLANNDVLEIASGDSIAVSYADEFTQSSTGGAQLLSTELMATYYDAGISPIGYDFRRETSGAVTKIRKQLIRIDPGERFIIEIVDYDMDRTDRPDTVTMQVSVNDGEPIELTATETDEYSGIFTKEVDTSSKQENEKLTVKPGDQIYCTYIDSQNTFPGHAVPREAIVYVNQPTDARVRIVETRVIRAQPESQQPAQFLYLPSIEKKSVSSVAFEVPLTVEVYDRDSAKDDRSTLVVQLTTTDGAKVDVQCVISTECSGAISPSLNNWALEEGRFIGQVVLQLGSKNSQDIVPLSTNMPRNLIGHGIIPEEKGGRQGGEALITRVLNLTGKDRISAIYRDELRPKGPAKELKAEGRLIANATLAVTDREYDKEVRQLHVGEKMFLMVTDADLDTSDERDKARVEIVTERGDKETVNLEETLAHSGVFTGSVGLRPSEQPTPGNLKPDDAFIESYFGDKVTLTYVDSAASTETGMLELTVELPVVVGTDGLVSSFSKTFNDEKLAVETKFHIAESFFELFKSHKTLGRNEELKSDLEAGRRVLREVMEDYPSPKYVPRIAYLRGQFAQELQKYDEAIESYQLIVRQFPDHSLAPDAQYKLAQAYEEGGKFDEALEAYVTLAATYPQSPLIASVMIRISDHFYRDKNYDVAAQVGEKFLEKFDGHQYAPKMAFRVGQCYYKAKEYRKAGGAFDKFAKIFPDDGLCADSVFWSGESYRMANDDRQAFRRYNKCRWDFPASEAAKYARGRLALPNMLNQFEAEANSVEE